MDQHIHRCWSKPEASLRVQGKPDKAGGLVMNTQSHPRKPVSSGGHDADIEEVRHGGRPTLSTYTCMEVGLSRRPRCVCKERPAKREAQR